MEEMRSLVDRLNQLNYHYYVLDEPLVSDDEWDALYKRLKQLAGHNCKLTVLKEGGAIRLLH